MVQEPGASLEGTGQIDAIQAVGIVGRSCGSWSHGDSAVSSNWPGRTVPCRTVVGHGARQRAAGNLLKLAPEL